MERINDSFVTTIETVISLQGLDVLEIGCGDGRRSAQIAARCKTLVAIDPDQEKVNEATSRQIPNARFAVGTAEDLSFDDQTFDVVIFSFSFHHVPTAQMEWAITEALRVGRPSSHLIFIEPSGLGAFYETEQLFGLFPDCQELQPAYDAIQNNSRLEQVAELFDEMDYLFDSSQDFIKTLSP